MSKSVGKICRKVGCPTICYDRSGFCVAHQNGKDKAFARKLVEPLPVYKTRDWKDFRLAILKRDPMCTACKKKPSTTAHHLKEARDFPDLIFDPENVVGVCTKCHNRESQKESMKGRMFLYDH